jgi:hypothetical protein
MIQAVDKARAAWLTSLGLLGAGWVAAHVLSYLILVPAPERSEMMARTGHSYFRPGDLLLLCGTLAVAGLALVLLGESVRRPIRPHLLALIPVLGFVVQEHLERTVNGGAFPVHLVTEPRFLLGFVLQVPFALCALLVTAALLRAANRLARALRAASVPKPLAGWDATILFPCLDLPRRAALAAGYSERGPPFSLSG